MPVHSGEDGARYLLSINTIHLDDIKMAAKRADIPLTVLGKTTGDKLTLSGEFSVSVENLANAHDEVLYKFAA